MTKGKIKNKSIPPIELMGDGQNISRVRSSSSSKEQLKALEQKIKDLRVDIDDLNRELFPLVDPLREMNSMVEDWNKIRDMEDGYEKEAQAEVLRPKVQELSNKLKQNSAIGTIRNYSEFKEYLFELDKLVSEPVQTFIKRGLSPLRNARTVLSKNNQRLETAIGEKKAEVHFMVLNIKIKIFNELCLKSTSSMPTLPSIKSSSGGQDRVKALELLLEIDFHARYLTNIASPEYEIVKEWYKVSNIPLQFNRFGTQENKKGKSTSSKKEIEKSLDMGLMLDKTDYFARKLSEHSINVSSLEKLAKLLANQEVAVSERIYAGIQVLEYMVYQILKALMEINTSEPRREDLHKVLKDMKDVIVSIKNELNLIGEDEESANLQARFRRFSLISAADADAQKERVELTRALTHKYTTHVDNDPSVFNEQELTKEYQKEVGKSTAVKTRVSLNNLSPEEKELLDARKLYYIEAESLVEEWRKNGALSRSRLKHLSKDIIGDGGDINMIAKGNNITWLVSDQKEDLNFILRAEKLSGQPEVDPNQLNSVEEIRSTPAGSYFAKEYITLVDKDSRITAVEYFPEGHLRGVRDNYDTDNVTNRQLQACHLMWQICDFCLKLLAEDKYYTDIKLTNFLLKITEDGRYVVSTADLKSIEKAIRNSIQELRGKPGKVTKNYAPPEFSRPEEQPYDMDKFMAYLLGVVLYDYLVGLDTKIKETEDHFILYEAQRDGSMKEIERISKRDQIIDNMNPHERIYQMAIKNRAYEESVFQGGLGIELRGLCHGLLEQNPKERLSLYEACERLRSLSPAHEDLPSVFKRKILKLQSTMPARELRELSSDLTPEETQLFKLIQDLNEMVGKSPIAHDPKKQDMCKFLQDLRFCFGDLKISGSKSFKKLFTVINDLKKISEDSPKAKEIKEFVSNNIEVDPLYQKYLNQYVTESQFQGHSHRLKRSETVSTKPENRQGYSSSSVSSVLSPTGRERSETVSTKPENRQGYSSSSGSSGLSPTGRERSETVPMKPENRQGYSSSSEVSGLSSAGMGIDEKNYRKRLCMSIKSLHTVLPRSSIEMQQKMFISRELDEIGRMLSQPDENNSKEDLDKILSKLQKIIEHIKLFSAESPKSYNIVKVPLKNINTNPLYQQYVGSFSGATPFWARSRKGRGTGSEILNESGTQNGWQSLTGKEKEKEKEKMLDPMYPEETDEDDTAEDESSSPRPKK